MIHGWFAALHPDNKAIAKGMAWVFGFVLVGKFIGAGKEIVVAARFGTGPELDAYIFLLNLCVWPIGIWFGVLTVVLVPLVQRIGQEQADGLRQFLSELLGYTVLVGVALGIIAYFLLGLWLHSPNCGLSSAAVAAGSRIVVYLVPVLSLGMVVSFYSAWMIADGRHSNTLLEALPALTIAGVLMMVVRSDGTTLAVGTLLGYLVHLTFLVLANRKSRGWIMPHFTLRSRFWAQFARGTGMVLIGQIFIGTIPVVDQFFAAEVGEGRVAALSYATRLWGLILGLGGIVVTRATLHVFSSTESRRQRGQTSTLARNWAILLFLAGVIVASAAWLMSTFMVRMLFERGAFTSVQTAVVAVIFRWGLLQVPFYFASLVWVSAISSQQRYSVLIWTGIVGLLVKIAANYCLVGIMGAAGIALSWALVYAVNFCYLAFVGRPNRSARGAI